MFIFYYILQMDYIYAWSNVSPHRASFWWRQEHLKQKRVDKNDVDSCSVDSLISLHSVYLTALSVALIM